MDRLFHHLQVEIEPDGGNMARLLFAEQIPSTANFKIRCGDAEARSQFGKLLDGGQPLLGIFREVAFIRHQEVGVGLFAAPPDSAAELIELGESERVGAIHDDGVGGRHVDARLDNGGGNEDIRFPVEEFQHHSFQRFRVHLAMGHDDAGFRHQFLEPGAHPLHGLHPIVDKVGLSASTEFAKNRLTDRFFTEAEDLSADRQSSRRGRIDDREVAHTRHSHL